MRQVYVTWAADANADGVFNPLGQRVARLVDNAQKAGYQETSWNADGFPSGVYFYSIELKVDGSRRVKLGKMVVVK